MKKKLYAFLLLLTFILPLNTFAQVKIKITPAEKKAAEAITSKQLSDYLHFIAADEMEGRDTPSRGLDTAAKFIATMLARAGVKPAGDNGTYFQRMWVVRTMTDSTASTLEVNGQKMVYGNDFYAAASEGAANAPLVFGGNGWFFKSKGMDAFSGVDVKGKIVVIYGEGIPKGVTRNDFQGTRGEDWADPQTYARAKGAAGMIIISPGAFNNWANISRQIERGGMSIENLREQSRQSMPTIYLSQAAANKLFEGESANPMVNPETKAFAFQNKTASIAAKSKLEKTPTQNVVAVIEGSDPVLKNEYVSIGAHYDHVGINQNTPGEDKIFNGADDDGSGTVAVLAMAEALAKSPKKPKRSTLFLWYAGEEKGLLGSAYFTKFPTVPFDKITVNINIDMIGRSRKPDNNAPTDKDLSGENEMYVIGSKMMSSTLGDLTESVNKNYLNMTYNFKYDDPQDPNQFFFRSDHYNFAVKGIPAVFFFNGAHVDYHGAGDHPDKIDYVRMEKVTRTLFLTMWELAELKDRPKVDKELPAELRQR